MQTQRDMPLDTIFRSLVDHRTLDRLLEVAIAEDLGERGDITSESIIEPDRRGRAAVVPREQGVLCGMPIAARLVERYAASGSLVALATDGERVEAGGAIARIDAPLRDLLRIERTMLNILGHLSGVATLTRQYVDAIAGTNAVICDTRKTTPGLRHLEKYAVRCGGGTSHRIGLHDAALYKDNHLAHFSSDEIPKAVPRAILHARTAAEPAFIEVEVDTLDQFSHVLMMEHGLVDIVLLDNMPPDAMREAVRMRDAQQPGMKLEASGGVTLENVRAIAEAGVDRIAIGAITHSAPQLDMGLDIE